MLLDTLVKIPKSLTGVCICTSSLAFIYIAILVVCFTFSSLVDMLVDRIGT
jgi:hypothetical protein